MTSEVSTTDSNPTTPSPPGRASASRDVLEHPTGSEDRGTVDQWAYVVSDSQESSDQLVIPKKRVRRRVVVRRRATPSTALSPTPTGAGTKTPVAVIEISSEDDSSDA